MHIASVGFFDPTQRNATCYSQAENDEDDIDTDENLGNCG
jgi:hypothetical protein